MMSWREMRRRRKKKMQASHEFEELLMAARA